MIQDLRYRMRDALRVLIQPQRAGAPFYDQSTPAHVTHENVTVEPLVEAHPFFGMDSQDTEPVAQVMARLRGGRHSDL